MAGKPVAVEQERLPRGAEYQCVVCTLVFSSLSAFDRHQIRGTKQHRRSAEAPVECLSPIEAGLVAYQHAGGETWGLPGEATDRFGAT